MHNWNVLVLACNHTYIGSINGAVQANAEDSHSDGKKRTKQASLVRRIVEVDSCELVGDGTVAFNKLSTY
jgi:hypothetical protein